jgi:hypothetical protein
MPSQRKSATTNKQEKMKECLVYQQTIARGFVLQIQHAKVMSIIVATSARSTKSNPTFAVAMATQQCVTPKRRRPQILSFVVHGME